MTEQMLVDLMGDLDVSLLQNDYMEHDLIYDIQKKKSHKRSHEKAWKRGAEFALTDSLKTAIYEQRELIDNMVAIPDPKDRFIEKVDVKVEAMKSRVHHVVAIISSIVAMLFLCVSLIVVVIKKWSRLRQLFKKTQTA